MTICSMEFVVWQSANDEQRLVTKEFVTLEKGDRHEWGQFLSVGLGALILTHDHQSDMRDWQEFNANDPRWVLQLARVSCSSHFRLVKIRRDGEEVT